MTPLRIALIGLGRMGRRHLTALTDLPGVEVCGVLDHHGTWPGPSYPDLGALLRATPDAVVIATPPASHHELAAKTDRVLAVGFVERFNPALPALPRDVTAISTRRTNTEPTSDPTVDVLLDLVVHDVDLVRHLTGKEYAETAVC